MKRKIRSAPMISIGAEKQAVIHVKNSIMSILKSGQDQTTIQKALDVLQHATSVTNTTITSCNFQGGE